MGFCVVNNVAIGAAHAIAELGCERVLIVDWDVHHGNGTQRAFFSRKDLLLFDTHQHPFYPGSGRPSELGMGVGEGFTANVAFSAGTGDGDYLSAFETILKPMARQFRPELVLVSAGFDAHRDDPLGGMEVTEAGFAALCSVVRGIADEFSQGRVVLVLEGGYDLHALAGSVHDCIEVLCGAEAPKIAAVSSRAGREAIERTVSVMKPFWNFL
jgi:acetoin utilization deacetylase AcuC-like enzyme